MTGTGTVRFNNALGFRKRNFNPCLSFEEPLELDVADAVTSAKNNSFANLSLCFVDIIRRDTVNLRRHEFVNISLLPKRRHKFVLPSQPRQHPRFDLR